MKAFGAMVLLCPIISAMEWSSIDSCAPGQDEHGETSLIQIKDTLRLGSKRSGPALHGEAASRVAHSQGGAGDNVMSEVMAGKEDDPDWEFNLGEVWQAAAKKKKQAFAEQFKADAANETTVAKKAYDSAGKSGGDPGESYYLAKIDADTNALNAYLANRGQSGKEAKLLVKIAKKEKKQAKKRKKQRFHALKAFGKKARDGYAAWDKKNLEQKEEAEQAEAVKVAAKKEAAKLAVKAQAKAEAAKLVAESANLTAEEAVKLVAETANEPAQANTTNSTGELSDTTNSTGDEAAVELSEATNSEDKVKETANDTGKNATLTTNADAKKTLENVTKPPETAD